MAINVLIVDDAAFMRKTLGDVIKSGGLNVIGEAENGKIGIAKFKELEPDIVTMDITMPEMDGLEALKKILEIDKTAKVVMVSAVGQQSNVLNAIKSGAKDFILKPFDANRVIATLKKIAEG
jgi:two-component system, chemotaxis family, chemotaxis protein CheY